MVRITVRGRREFGEVEDFGQELWIESCIFVSFWCSGMFDIDIVGVGSDLLPLEVLLLRPPMISFPVSTRSQMFSEGSLTPGVASGVGAALAAWIYDAERADMTVRKAAVPSIMY